MIVAVVLLGMLSKEQQGDTVSVSETYLSQAQRRGKLGCSGQRRLPCPRAGGARQQMAVPGHAQLCAGAKNQLCRLFHAGQNMLFVPLVADTGVLHDALAHQVAEAYIASRGWNPYTSAGKHSQAFCSHGGHFNNRFSACVSLALCSGSGGRALTCTMTQIRCSLHRLLQVFPRQSYAVLTSKLLSYCQITSRFS